MKLVMCYSIGDGCTFSCDVTLPIEYESAEAAIVEFERLCLEARALKWPDSQEFWFAGHEFEPSPFFWRNTPDRFDSPDFLTIDEWFAREGQ